MTTIVLAVFAWLILGLLVSLAFGAAARVGAESDRAAHALSCKCKRDRLGRKWVDVRCVYLNRMLAQKRAQMD